MTFFIEHKRRFAAHDNTEMTKQAHKDECDINRILKQYSKTGIINHIRQGEPVFADLPDPLDFQEALSVVSSAQAAFSELPALVRARFDNNPAALLEALNDPAMWPELRELGILKPDPYEAPQEAQGGPSDKPAASTTPAGQ